MKIFIWREEKMTQARFNQTQLRRTYTNARQNEDDSVFISSTSSISDSEKSTHASEEKYSENIVKNTSNTEVGKPTKKSKSQQSGQQTIRFDAIPLSEDEKKIIEFFKKLENHKDPKKSKKDLVEEFIRSNATEAFMRDMNKISNKEIARLEGNKAAKWLSIFASGSISQNTSFFLASELAIATNQPWLFPTLSTFLSEGLSDKAAALTRRTTFGTNDAKNLYRKQRLIARAIGDMIRQCGGLKPEAKYRSNNPAHKGQKFTAWDALWSDSDRFLTVSAHNMINRGVPFLCFTGTYLFRDFLLKGVLKGAPGWQTLLLRWGSGIIAGGSTALLNQIITSNNKDATETPGYSTSYWHAKETYLHSVRLDIRDRLNEAKELTDSTTKTKLENLLLDLDKKIQREIGVAGLKKSIWTAIPGEIKASAHRSRPEDSLDPDVPGTLAQSIHSACGKFISLIYFTYMLDQAMKSENNTDSFSSYPALNFVFLNFALILMGFMWKDDLQIVSRTGHAVKKSLRDVTTGRAAYQERNAKPLDDVTTNMPEQINANDGNDDENDADNRVAGGPKVKFADELSIEILTDREREARDRKREYEKKEEASTTASYANKKPAKMSGSADSDSGDDSSSSSKKVEVSSSSSSQSAARSSTKTYDDDNASSSEESPTPKRKRQS
jgi:hypothetical protein